jgi:hypothetical protein
MSARQYRCSTIRPPRGNARIDGFFQLWLLPIILGFLGLVFTAVGGGGIIADMRSTDRAPLPSPTGASDAEHPAPS